ncbi:MAG TPA: 50S ribosomal protein L9 [Gammaproteobacteria bacterium]|nr:50S ribosomal protein L9 [Gammaproteobacteria bacterium]
MEVILLESVQKLGELGDKVTVKSGYGRNFLIPQKKAVPATAENLQQFEERRADLEAVAGDKLSIAKNRAKKVDELSITITTKAGEEGKLFGSITVRDVAEASEAAGVKLEKSEVRLPDGPIRELGEFEINIHLHPEVDAVLKLAVVAEA